MRCRYGTFWAKRVAHREVQSVVAADGSNERSASVRLVPHGVRDSQHVPVRVREHSVALVYGPPLVLLLMELSQTQEEIGFIRDALERTTT